MSILSWDDFEDDTQKPTAPEHKSASLDSQKTVNTQVVSDSEQPSPRVAVAQPTGTSTNRSTNPTDSLARASQP
jgi:ribonucleoside-diphosphate reductase beta chain